MDRKGKKIIIVGGNFAGLTAASRLSRRHRVAVIDPGAEFQWTPNIHEILSGVKSPQQVQISRAELIERFGHRFVRDEVTALNPATRTVRTAAGDTLAYDACVVASGGVRDTAGVPGVERHAIGFRDAEDCRRIEAGLKRLVARGKPVSIVIVGAGVSGIEGLGEILRNHRHDPNVSIDVVERAPEILPGLPAALAADLRERAGRHRVRFHTGVAVKKITPRRVYLAGAAALPSDLTIWAAGQAPPEYLRRSGLIPAGHRWVPVTQTLQSRKSPLVLAAGDSAELPSPLRKQAYYAIDTGAMAADNVERLLAGRPLKRFRPARKPMLVAFGDLDTYLVAGQTVLASKYLAAAKESVYQLYMARLSAALPPLSFSRGVATRFAAALKDRVIPQLTSCNALGAIRDTRVVSLGG